MSTRTSHRTDAIVLRSFDYGESDQIITFMTSDFGKLRGIAKGARRSRKRFINTLEPYTRLSLIFSTKGYDTLSLIEGADIVDHYSAIRGDLEKTLAASYLVDLVDQFSRDGKLNDELFNLLGDVLCIIAKDRTSEVLIRVFELRLLKLVGYEPVLDRCLGCRTALCNDTFYVFSPAEGGLRCRTCGTNSPDPLPVSLGTIKTLLMGKEIHLDRIHRLALSTRSAKESRELLSAFIRHLLGVELKSARVVSEICNLLG
jgi:DNA repair protein RecO (recombination protein O)